MDNPPPLSDSLAGILAGIEKSRRGSPLASHHTEILAASKGQPASVIEAAIRAGIGLFGENRVQEAHQKWPAIKARYPHIRLHLIGPLQTNKAKDAMALFDTIQTLDRPKLAEAFAKEHVGDRRLATKNYFIQINTGEEPQKAGIIPQEADGFIRYCTRDLKLNIVGLMCIPPADQPGAPHFALLREIARRHGLGELSMGMSGDYETAVRMGATCVRIGTALFGERKVD